jgi:hypothetical protein
MPAPTLSELMLRRLRVAERAQRHAWNFDGKATLATAHRYARQLARLDEQIGARVVADNPNASPEWRAAAATVLKGRGR